MIIPGDHFWYIPNENRPGHRGDATAPDHNSLATLTALARAAEDHGWRGALLGTGWGRPDTFTVATALVARTSRFEPLIAVRPGYWNPLHLASAGATLDHLSGGRVRFNVVSGRDGQDRYGDPIDDPAARYARTREFMRLLRRVWTSESVDFAGAFYRANGASVAPKPVTDGARRHPPLYFGGASAAAETVAAGEADVQMFWGEPLAGIAERIDRLRMLSRRLDRDLPPLQFGLRITTVIRETSAEAWAAAEARVATMARAHASDIQHRRGAAVGQQRLIDLQHAGDVLDDNLYTAPGRYGAGGAGTTWLVGSAAEVARSLRKYAALGIGQFILSDTPYLDETRRQGDALLPLLRAQAEAVG